MFALEAAWWTFLLRTAVVYLGLLVGLRLFGRRELGQMTPFDLVVILLIANTLQNAMVGPDTSVTGGLLAALTLLTINWLLTMAEVRIPWLRHAAEGEPVLLVSNGELLTRRLKRERISLEALGQAAREHGLSDLSAVDAAILEIDGTLSIIPKRDDTPRTRHHVRRVNRPR